MTQQQNPQSEGGTSDKVQLERSTYEIIRSRIASHTGELRDRLGKLNQSRRHVFGAIETRLLANERITTDNNCIPRDIVPIGDRFIFGYNVHIGLKSETQLSDVFAVYQYRDGVFQSQPLDLFADATFQNDFRQLYKYYKQTTFARFFVRGPYLYMVFQVGKTSQDIKAFKWLLQDAQLTYVDSRSDHEVRYPPQHEFEWKRTTRDQHRKGIHPHISIDDRLFVETIGGDLTIKVEDNTDTGEGIYAEPVDNADQVLDDAEVYYTILDNVILLKIRPYQEELFRYIVFNEKLKQAQRLDAIKDACVLLPEGHGLIFSSGYYLKTGECRTFESGISNLLFERRISAVNGEDHLHVFYNRDVGTYVMLLYNVIEQRVERPIVCSGFSLFRNGQLIFFKKDDQPQRHHALQIWQTPFVSDLSDAVADTDSYLYKVGNQDLVRGMAECHEIINLTEKDDTYANLYLDLAKKCSDVLDSYFWINHQEAFQLGTVLAEIRSAAVAAIDEFEKVVRVRQNTQAEFVKTTRATEKALQEVRNRRYEQIQDYVTSLAELRGLRGQIITLRDLRYVDVPAVERLEQNVVQAIEHSSSHCVEFLLRDDALAPYVDQVQRQLEAIGQLSKVADANQLEQQLGQTSDSLEMLIDVVSNLKIDDATQRTTIIEDISAVYAQLNQSRAALKKKKQELLSVEGVAEFHSQVKLLNQALVNYLDVCNSAAKCEEYLTKLMVQVEELEGRFAEFDDFVVQLGEKREEIYSAFESRKVALVESRNRRANALMSTAQRILKGLETRVAGLTDVAEIHAYFASDLMVDKVRDIVRQLAELEDSVKVDDIQSQLKTIREDAVRQLKDRQELFVDGENIIQLGKHRFTVNVQPLDLTIIRREQGHFFHLTGTNFLEQIEDPTLDECRLVWDQETVAENRDVYRAEYLAYQLLQQGEAEGTAELNRLSRSTDDQLRDHVHEFMASRHSEAYVKGVHDHDALKLLRALLHQRLQAGFLRYAPETRALVALFWQTLLDRQESDSPSRRTVSRIRSAGAVARRFPQSKHRQQAIDLLQRKITRFVEKSSLFDVDIVEHAAKCCFDLVVQSSLLPVGPRAARIVKAFDEQSRRDGFQDEVQGTLESLASGDRFRSLREWIAATTDASSDDWRPGDIDEATAVVLNGGLKQRPVLGGDDVVVVEGLVGDHPRLQGHAYQLDYSAFHQRLNAYRCDVVPRYQQYVETKHQLTSRKRKLLRLEEFHPRVLTSFVRNRLIDQVYLPLIGDNLAKQIGAAGDAKRTDLMGLLMLISPPGYGKTTLMEYVANRLGITFVKINGPAVGHQVRSLDPAEAPNASARQEVEKLNLSLEMGDNVMIYVDDIQHCHPEFLQKFISLCDAQRKIEGVYHGQPRTYDLRGRKVAVVMAGNPYTESGEKFQVPDMLANRADTYNLGDVIGDSREAFELSYLENAMTSNPVLSIIAGRSSKDLTAIIKLAQTDSPEGIDLEATYSVDELNEMVSVVRKLIQLRNVVLRVNQQYIQSAAQSAAYRTEPPFKLQGSYRDMNKLAERVVAVMNDDELQQLILSHYENQAQTLATDAEANLLKLRQLLGLLDDEQTKRWQEICRRFQRNLLLGSTDDGDRMTQVIAQMTTFSEGLHHIREALVAGARQLVEQKQHPPVPVVSDPTPPPAPQIQVPQIQVAYKVPKVFLEVIKAQFAVMDGWIQPFLQLSRSTQADTESLRQSVHQAMQAYSALIAKMEKANGDETEENA